MLLCRNNSLFYTLYKTILCFIPLKVRIVLFEGFSISECCFFKSEFSHISHISWEKPEDINNCNLFISSSNFSFSSIYVERGDKLIISNNKFLD